IRGSAELLKKRFGDHPEEAGLSEFIIDEVNRLSRVVNDFLMFARPPVPILEEVTVESLIDRAPSFKENQVSSESFVYKKEIQPDIPTIAADMDLCRQVFLNLFINAQDAMSDGGTITIHARRLNSREVAIEVIDQGTGIPSDQLARIFDPFFTSKDNGTGLGLSLVHQIMSSHGGRMEVDSTLNQGSIFRVVFPTYRAAHKESSTTVLT